MPVIEILQSGQVVNRVLADLAWAEEHHPGSWRMAPGVESPVPVDPSPIPQTITRAQGKAALIQAGLWPQVLAFMAGIEDPNDKLLAEVALNDTVNWERSSPFLARVAAELGLSQQQLDELFIAAAAIVL